MPPTASNKTGLDVAASAATLSAGMPSAASASGRGEARSVNPGILNPSLLAAGGTAVERFCGWLERYGEDSLDFQTFYAGPYGKFAKGLYYRQRMLGTIAVAPIIFCEAFVPAARRVFFHPQRFPIADAHYSMGFTRLFQRTRDLRHLARATHFLDVLLETACPGGSGLGWGYPFDWVTIDGIIPTQTPLITTLPYVYERFPRPTTRIPSLAGWR